MGFCTQCGQEIRDGLKFCTSCGAKIEQKTEGLSPEKKADAPVVTSSSEEKEHSLKLPTAIGIMILVCLISLFIGTLMGQKVERVRNHSGSIPSQVSRSTTSTLDHPAINSLNAFLNDINSKNWEAAYSKASDRGRLKTPYLAFTRNWGNNLGVVSEQHQVVKVWPDKVKIYVLLTSSDLNVKTQKEERYQYEGIVKFVQENGQWKITDPLMSYVRRIKE